MGQGHAKLGLGHSYSYGYRLAWAKAKAGHSWDMGQLRPKLGTYSYRLASGTWGRAKAGRLVSETWVKAKAGAQLRFQPG